MQGGQAQRDRDPAGRLARPEDVPVRAPDPHVLALQPTPGAPGGHGQRLPAYRLPRHLGLGTRRARALSASVPVVEDLELTAQLSVDDTLLPCWSWRRRPGT